MDWAHAQDVLAILHGKWTLSILDCLADQPKRTSELGNALGLSRKVLNESLQPLIHHEVVVRCSVPETPPGVRYELTRRGRAVLAMLDQMDAQWDTIQRRDSRDTAVPPRFPDAGSRVAPRRDAPEHYPVVPMTMEGNSVSMRASSQFGVHPERPNVARMYDYYLGGKDNYEADRAAADQVLTHAPQAPAIAQENRKFISRAITYLTARGIRQFIDLGSGLPTQENVHEVAQRATPHPRVVYADNDPVVLSHARALLVDDDQTTVIDADMRHPDEVLTHPDLLRMIDLSQPVALLFVSVLHCLTDADAPDQVVARFGEAVAPGSHLVISHITAGDQQPQAHAGAQVYRDLGATSNMVLRDYSAILSFFDGTELIEPGLVPLPRWRPEPAAGTPSPSGDELPTWQLCGLGRW